MPCRHPRALPILILTLLLHGRIMPARATTEIDPRETARALANQAADALARGEYEQAEGLLQRAYQQYPAPTIALLHARTLVHLQRLALAAIVYQRATLASLTPDSPEAFRRAVQQASHEANELKPRIPRLQVSVRGRAALQPGLTVTLDGRAVPPAQHGRWILVDPGRRVVGARLGNSSSEQLVRLEERQSVVVEVSEPPSQRPVYQALTSSALGVGVAGITAGIVTGTVSTSAHAHAVEQCPNNQCPEGGEGAGNLQRFRTYRVLSTVGYALGAVGLGVGGYLLINGAVDGPALKLELDQQSARLSLGAAL